MFDCLVLCKPIITYIWLYVCLISIKQSLLFFLHWFLWKLAYIFSLVVWLFDSRQTMYNVNVYDWKQTCLHLAFRFITFVMHFIFTIFFVRPQPCMLEFGREFFRWLDRECLRVTNNAIQRSLGWSFYQTLCKDNHFWGNLHFSFNNLFYKLFDVWNKDPCFFVSWYSWMFPNSFILVLLDFVWYCYHQLFAISLSFLIWSLYVTFGEVCFLLMLIEWSREIGVSVWNYYQLYFSL